MLPLKRLFMPISFLFYSLPISCQYYAKSLYEFWSERASLSFNPAQHMLSKNVFKRNKNYQRGPFSNTSSYILRGAGWPWKQKNGNANFLAALQFTPLNNKTVLLKILPNVKLGIVSTVLCVLGKLLGSWFVGKLFLKHCNQSRLPTSDVPQPSRQT